MVANLGHIARDLIRVIAVAGQDRGPELLGIVRFDVGRLIRHQAVRRRVRLVKAIARKRRHQIEHLVGNLLVHSGLARAVEELGLLLLHDLLFLFAHGAAQQVGATEAIARQRPSNLHHLLLVDDDAVGLFEDALHRRVVVDDGRALVLAVDKVVDHAAFQRSRSIQRTGGDDVLKAVGL